MKLFKFLIILVYFFASCNAQDQQSKTDVVKETVNEISDEASTTEEESISTEMVIVQNASSTGEENNYSLNVTLASPDTGCDQYADWWEVITESGELIYRRILTHSHVTEQPFTRSGSNIDITADQTIIIRGHMNNLGYGTQALKGTINTGFETEILKEGFASDLLESAPLPNGCAF